MPVIRSATPAEAAEYCERRWTPSASESIVGSSDDVIARIRLERDVKETEELLDPAGGVMSGSRLRCDSERREEFMGAVEDVGCSVSADSDNREFQDDSSDSRLVKLGSHYVYKSRLKHTVLFPLQVPSVSLRF
jgi:hypothetical protein